MQILTNHFCIFNNNLRKYLLMEAGSIVICHLFCVVVLPSDMHSFLFLFSFPLFLSWPLPSFLLPSLPLPNCPLSLYACVTAHLQFRWRCICLYLANFKPGLKNGRHAAEYVLFLQCHNLIPSDLFTDIHANWKNKPECRQCSDVYVACCLA